MGIEVVLHALEESIVAVTNCRREGDAARVEEFLGTAFFIDRTGLFLTAAHVAKNYKRGSTALCVKPDAKNQPLSNLWAFVDAVEFAPDGIDVAIGKVGFATELFFEAASFAEGLWLDVVACGYPENAIDRRGDKFILPMRGLKGYVQREILDPTDLGLPFKGTSLELSFPVTRGMSGSPLYATRSGRIELVGVCTASHASEIVDYEHLNVDDEGQRYSERKVRVEEAGIAVSLKAIANWKPNLIGTTLWDRLDRVARQGS